MKQSNFEFNCNSVYLRNRDLSLHYKKLQEIHGRKNFFLDRSEKPPKSENKNKLPKMNLDHQFKIIKDNNYLIGKLFQISSREVSKPLVRNTKSNESVRHYMNVQTLRKLKEKTIQEENLNIFRRLQEGPAVIKPEKLENNYKNHLKLKKLIQKVDTSFNKLYIENQLIPIKSKKPSTSSSDYYKMSMNSCEGLFPTFSNFNNLPNYGKLRMIDINNYEVDGMKKSKW